MTTAPVDAFEALRRCLRARRAACMLALAAALPAAFADTEAPRDAALMRAVLGKWCLSDDDNKSCWGYNVLRADGSFSSSGVHPETRRPFHIEGTFEAKGHLTCFLAIRNDSELNPRAGESICSTILKVEAGRQVFRQYGDDTLRTIYRVPEDATAR